MATKTKSTKKTAAKAKSAAPAKTETKGNTVLKTICADLGIDPKTARRVLRKKMRTKKEDGGHPEIAKFHTIKTRWVQDAKAAGTIRTVLREYLDRAAA